MELDTHLIAYYPLGGWELFPHFDAGGGCAPYWVLGFIAALLLFVSVLLHELSHSFVAKARGLKVRDITLFMFGGASNIEDEPKKAGDEFLIAVVGPLTSLVLAGLFLGLEQLVTPPVHKSGAMAAAILQYLAEINFLLAVFNLIPGFPLDGGRVLRSIIWAINHNFERATRYAGFIGELFAYLFIFYGLYKTFFNDNLFGGLWIAFIGWFLLNAAQQSVAGAAVHGAVQGMTVAQAMEPSPQVVAPHMTLAHLLSLYILPYNLRAVPVVRMMVASRGSSRSATSRTYLRTSGAR